MTKISTQGKKIEIGSEIVEFDTEILDAKVVDGTVIVLFNQGDMDPRNVIALNENGEQMWQIQPLKKPGEDGSIPVGELNVTENTVQVRDVGQNRYELDVETGEVEYLGWSR